MLQKRRFGGARSYSNVTVVELLPLVVVDFNECRVAVDTMRAVVEFLHRQVPFTYDI